MTALGHEITHRIIRYVTSDLPKEKTGLDFSDPDIQQRWDATVRWWEETKLQAELEGRPVGTIYPPFDFPEGSDDVEDALSAYPDDFYEKVKQYVAEHLEEERNKE